MDKFISSATIKKVQDTIQTNFNHFKRVGGGAKFFTTSKRGELAELHNDLNSTDKEKQANAVKRIIANMTLGRDVSQMFTDVVKLGHTYDTEVKKLVYLYVLNNAKLRPDKALMAVNTFLQDSQHQSPIVRALAIRTMLCLRVEGITEYTMEPLRKAIRDNDPYVRKTAAIGILKVFHQNPRLFEVHGFAEELERMLSDTVPIVVSNAAIVICELNAYAPNTINLTQPLAQKLLSAMSECTEWGQTYVLEWISSYTPVNAEDAENIVERVLPRLSHANPSVVLGAIKVIAIMLSFSPADSAKNYVARINSALLTLATTDSETQYVVCRNIQVLLEVLPSLLANDLGAFFIRFSDPPYVKIEKLRLMLRLTSPSTAPQVMTELAEYVTEVDQIFVTEVIKVISQVAIKVEASVPKCIQLLLQTAAKKPEFINEVVVASKDVVRKYPNCFLDLVVVLVQEHSADAVEDERAQVALLWMVGEFCDLLENGMKILGQYIEDFRLQTVSVQLAVLSAVVKVFLRDPAGMEATLNHVLDLATTHSDNPDLRDKAYLYWRLLARGIGVEKMKHIIHGNKAPVDVVMAEFRTTMTTMDMMRSINTVAAVYQRPASSFLPSYGVPETIQEGEDEEEELEGVEGEQGATPPTSSPTTSMPSTAAISGQVKNAAASLDDLFGGGAAEATPSTPPPPPSRPQHDDLFGDTAPTSTKPVAPAQRHADPFDDMFEEKPKAPAASSSSTSPARSLPLVLPSAAGNGLRVNADIVLTSSNVALEVELSNEGPSPIGDFVIQINKNAFSFLPLLSLAKLIPSPIGPGASQRVQLPLSCGESHLDPAKIAIEIGVKCSSGLHIFSVPVPQKLALASHQAMEKKDFVTMWKSIPDTNEVKLPLPSIANQRLDAVQATLGQLNLPVVAVKSGQDQDSVYGSFRTHQGVVGLYELVVLRSRPADSFMTIKSVRSQDFVSLMPYMLKAV